MDGDRPRPRPGSPSACNELTVGGGPDKLSIGRDPHVEAPKKPPSNSAYQDQPSQKLNTREPGRKPHPQALPVSCNLPAKPTPTKRLNRPEASNLQALFGSRERRDVGMCVA